jgi:hypothetical protein
LFNVYCSYFCLEIKTKEEEKIRISAELIWGKKIKSRKFLPEEREKEKEIEVKKDKINVKWAKIRKNRCAEGWKKVILRGKGEKVWFSDRWIESYS